MADTKQHDQDVAKEFSELVNMTPGALEKWLVTEESGRVGFKGPDGKGEGESVGHKSGERIVEILHKKKADLDADDHAHMAKVVGYIKRHMAQRPEKERDELAHSNWTYSLKNWGHDPMKD